MEQPRHECPNVKSLQKSTCGEVGVQKGRYSETKRNRKVPKKKDGAAEQDWKHKEEKNSKLEMWANAQRDGRPAEYRWRRLLTPQFG